MFSTVWTSQIGSQSYTEKIKGKKEIEVVSSVYLRLLVFLLAVLILACVSSSLAFCMMYTAYNLNKQGDNIQA